MKLKIYRPPFSIEDVQFILDVFDLWKIEREEITDRDAEIEIEVLEGLKIAKGEHSLGLDMSLRFDWDEIGLIGDVLEVMLDTDGIYIDERAAADVFLQIDDGAMAVTEVEV